MGRKYGALRALILLPGSPSPVNLISQVLFLPLHHRDTEKKKIQEAGRWGGRLARFAPSFFSPAPRLL
jgi:hypothetical protein